MYLRRDWWIGDAECVGYKDATNDTSGSGFNFERIVSGLALIFDIFSIIGALFIIITYYAFRDLRTRARLILLMISLADLINAISYGSAFIYNIFTPEYSFCYLDKSKFEISVCVAQATFSNFSNNASIIWTAILGIQITFLFSRARNTLTNKKIFYVITILAWSVPLLVSVLGLFLNIFGPGDQNVNVGWCFISSYYKLEPNITSDNDDGHFILQLLMAKVWEVVIFLVLVVTYSISLYKACKYRKMQRGNWGFTGLNDLRLIWIPIIFFLLKIWGNIRWVLNLSLATNSSMAYFVTDLVLSILQAIGDPGQGWANAVFYILFNEELRQRTWANLKIYCCVRRGRGVKGYSERTSLVSQQPRKETVM